MTSWKYLYRHLTTDPSLGPDVPGPEVRVLRTTNKVFINFKKRKSVIWPASMADAISQCRKTLIHKFQKGPVDITITELDTNLIRDARILEGMSQ